MKRLKMLALLLLTASVLVSCTVVYGDESAASTPEVSLPTESDIDNSTVSELIGSGTQITLAGDTATFEGGGVSLTGSDVYITESGVYVLSGELSNGRIVVITHGGDITLVLNGCKVSCDYSSAVFAYRADKLTLTVAPGSENILSDATVYNSGDDLHDNTANTPNACIYSVCDTAINGSGSLVIRGNSDGAIKTEKSLSITGTHLTAFSEDNAVTASGISLSSCSLELTADNNGINAGSGALAASECEVKIISGGDSIQASGDILLDGGIFDLTSGGGHDAVNYSIVSLKGIKGGGNLTVRSGNFKLNCKDDGINAAKNLIIEGGKLTIASGDDGLHADGLLDLRGGDVTITDCVEGAEGQSVSVSGGSFTCVAQKNGIDTYGDGAGAVSAASVAVEISGGIVDITSSGDGINTAGKLSLSGGVLSVFCDSVEGCKPIDSSVFNVTDGVMLTQGHPSYGSRADNQGVNQCRIRFTSPLEAGSCIKLECGEQTTVIFIRKTCGGISYIGSLERGATLNVFSGGSYSGSDEAGFGTGGEYTGGNLLLTSVISDYYTEVG